MKNAAIAWLAGQQMHYAGIPYVLRFYSASDFKGSDSVQIKIASASGVTPRRIVAEQPNAIVSTVYIAPRAACKLRSLISTMYAAMRIHGQRSIDQQIRKQHEKAAEESGFNESDHLEPVDGQPRKEDLERIERYKYMGL